MGGGHVEEGRTTATTLADMAASPPRYGPRAGALRGADLNVLVALPSGRNEPRLEPAWRALASGSAVSRTIAGTACGDEAPEVPDLPCDLPARVANTAFDGHNPPAFDQQWSGRVGSSVGRATD